MYEMQLKGLDQLRQKMKKLDRELTDKLVRRSARKAMTVLRDRARENAKGIDDPKTAAAIWKNIDVMQRTKTARRMGPGHVVFSVGIRGGAAQYANTKENVRKRRVGQTYLLGGETWYWRLLEFGTEHMAAKPFLMPALYQTSSKIVVTFTDDLSKRLDKEIAKL